MTRTKYFIIIYASCFEPMNTDIDVCIIIVCVPDNLHYSYPIIRHQICKCRFMQVRRSSLFRIKKPETGLSNGLNILKVKFNFPQQNTLTAILVPY